MVMTATIRVRTEREHQLVDITDEVDRTVRSLGVKEGVCHIFVAGATASVVVHEGDDPALEDDLLDLLAQLIPQGRWRHDRIDRNGAAHLKSAWIGPSEVLPVRGGALAMGTWQRLFLCEFDGPRSGRPLHLTILGDTASTKAQ